MELIFRFWSSICESPDEAVVYLDIRRQMALCMQAQMIASREFSVADLTAKWLIALKRKKSSELGDRHLIENSIIEN